MILSTAVIRIRMRPVRTGSQALCLLTGRELYGPHLMIGLSMNNFLVGRYFMTSCIFVF
jgi:hypothetical protein